jgi:hypothetical protein
MRLKKECIGSTHFIKFLDKNITIEDNKDQFEVYKFFKLDVFESDPLSQTRKKYKGVKNDSDNEVSE